MSEPGRNVPGAKSRPLSEAEGTQPEVQEDSALAKAIEEGRKIEKVDRSRIFDVLGGGS